MEMIERDQPLMGLVAHMINIKSADMHFVVRGMEQSTLTPMPASTTTSFSKGTHTTTDDSSNQLVSNKEL